MQSYVSKRVPAIDSTIRQVGFIEYPLANPRIRNRAPQYDGPVQLMWMRGYTSVQTPSYKSLKKRDLPVNPYYAYTFVITDSRGTVRAKADPQTMWTGMGHKTMGTSVAALKSIDLTSTYTSAVMAEAEQKALKKLSDLKFNAGVAFVERRRTADMLIKSVNRFVTFALCVKKGNFRAANRVLRSREGLFGGKNQYLPSTSKDFSGRNTTSSTWLEYSYGWKPLLGDIYGAAELLAQQHLENRPSWVRGVHTFHRNEPVLYSSEGLTSRGNVISEYSAVCTLYYDIDDAARKLLQQTGILNPGLIAWEVVPFSFVVDWFIPVGRYIENLTATSGCKFLKGHTSLKTKWTGSASASTDGSVYSSVSPFRASLNGVQLYRVKHLAWPAAAFPTFSLGLNTSQVLSGLALLNQIFGRR